MAGSIKVYKSFIQDALEHGDSSFARRVLSHLYDEYEGRSNSQNDHRYHGIENAWIRYLSRGSTSYRIILIKEGEKSVFYRCGNHSIEDNLIPPSSSNEIIDLEIREDGHYEMISQNAFLTNHHKPIMLTAFLARNLIPHKEVYLISPFIDPDLLQRGSKIGKLLDNMHEDGAEIRIVTSFLSLSKFDTSWKNLATRGIDIVFMPRLHSKIYLFLTNREYPDESSNAPNLGIIGSSNLTNSGIPEILKTGNHETNYSIAEESIDKLHNLAIEHYLSGHDFRKAKHLSKKINI